MRDTAAPRTPMALARALVRRRGWILAGWVVLTALLAPSASRVHEVLEPGARIDGSESATVEALLHGPLASRFARVAVVVISGTPDPRTPAGAGALREIAEGIRHAPGVIGVISWLDLADTLFLDPTSTTTFLVVGLDPAPKRAESLIPALRGATEHLAERQRVAFPAVAIRWTGEAALNLDLRASSARDVQRAERRILPLTALLLVLVFGAVVAALLPVGAGALAILLALGASTWVATHLSASTLLPSVVTMLGLGLGIDYALLIVTRFREEVDAGADRTEAAVVAAHHAGHTILLSASVVALGFFVLLAVPLNELRAIAIGGLLAVTSSALVATTLVPGVLAWLGTRVDLGRVRPRRSREAGARWRWIGREVTGHPWLALLFGAAPLLWLAMHAARIHTGLPAGDWLPPEMESAQAWRTLRTMGRGNVIQSLRVVLALPADSSVRRSSGWKALAALDSILARDPRVGRVRSFVDVARGMGMGRTALALAPDSVRRGLVSSDGRYALLEVVPADSLSADALTRFVRDLRAKGDSLAGMPGAHLRVGGLPAFNADYQQAVSGRFVGSVLLLLLGTVVGLALGTGSLVVPLKAVLLNLLSVAAAFGVLALRYPDALFSSVPIVVFCIVFGLSMDYEVFLVTRVQELRHAGHDDRSAIVESLVTTGPVITNAAAIMVVVFSAFMLSDLLVLAQLGTALTAAVLLDATLVRLVLGPALLQVAGRWNWWPRTLP